MSMEGSYICINGLPELGKIDNDPDVMVISTEELSIKIDEVRKIISYLAIKPLKRKGKIVIIYEAEKLTEEAQNAFLKTLEEPAENAVILLQTSDADLLLPTINSRCKILDFGIKTQDYDENEIREFLEKVFKSDARERMRLAEEIGTKRAEVLEFLNKVLLTCHKLIDKKYALVAEQTFKAKKYLKANTNVKLAVENWLLKL